MEWSVHGERRVYESRWVNLDLVDVELPDGQRFEHHVVRMQRVAGAVVLDGAGAGRVLLLWRHRFIDGTWGWEIPVGIVETGESSAHTAAREVEEETGWRPGALIPLVTYQPCIGIADTPHDLFVAAGAEQVGEPTDRTEAARVEWIALAEVPTLVDRGEIRDAATLVGLMKVMLGRDGSKSGG
jgi:8-oxo-dGTP pyrophosphatase MutT (NUDIX family)